MSTLTSQTYRNRWAMILIALISIVPFALAWYYAKHPEWIAKRSNYGHLIIPPRPLHYGELAVGPVLDEIKGRWVLAQIVAEPTCREKCRTSLHATKQLRLMLNKDISRVRRLVLPAGANTEVDGIIRQDGDLLRGLDGGTLRRILEQAVGRTLPEGSVILLDPFANAMMWYEPGFDPYGALKDLKHLLRASQIG